MVFSLRVNKFVLLLWAAAAEVREVSFFVCLNAVIGDHDEDQWDHLLTVHEPRTGQVHG